MKVIEKHYRENYPTLVKRMTRRVGDEWSAEDVVQESYTRALKYRRSFNGDNFDKWFSRILNNALRDFQREERGYVEYEFEEEEAEGVPCNQYNEEVVKEIYDLIDTKSIIQIEVLSLYFKQGYTAIDITKLTDTSYAACHQIIQRFRNELKELYK